VRLSVIGCGRLGAPYAAATAQMGHRVLGLDTDPATIRRLRAGCAPFGEPGLHEAIAYHTRTGNLRFTSSYDEAAGFADLHIICVGTPQQQGGLAMDLGDLRHAVTQLAERLTRDAVLVVKSSVPFGTTAHLADLARSCAPAGIGVSVVCSPDFMREATSIDDLHHPSRIVLGLAERDAHAETVLREAWAPQLDAGAELLVTDLATAELSKTAANAFLATKVSFINAMAALCEASSADVTMLARSLALDPRIGPHGLDAGLGFGGSCLPKDLRGLLATARDLGVGDDLRLLADVDAINLARQRRITGLARQACGGDLNGKRAGLWGLSFKPGTDDIRESPALTVALNLYAQGATVTACDPLAGSITGAQHPQLRIASDPVSAATGADVLLHLTAWPQFAEITPGQLRPLVRTPIIIDGRASLDRMKWAANGWTYIALGRCPGTEQIDAATCALPA
jgi:UDPglucose 6-dehydrogenase